MIPKFRTWEKNMNVMIPVENIDFLAKQINTNSVWRMFHEIELMQYTGQKDDYGYDLYEGDIVEVHRNTLDRYIIRFVDGGFVFASNYGDRFSYMHMHVFLEADYEIIKLGNKFEHPHLLEGADE